MNSKDNPDRRQYQIDNGYTRTCSKCGVDKGIEEYYWQKAHNTSASACKVCWKSNNKKRWREDNEYRTRHQGYITSWLDSGGKEHINKMRRDLYAQDDEYRSQVQQRNKTYMAKTREQRNEHNRWRYHNDPEYRATFDAAQKRYKDKLKEQRK